MSLRAWWGDSRYDAGISRFYFALVFSRVTLVTASCRSLGTSISSGNDFPRIDSPRGPGVQAVVRRFLRKRWIRPVWVSNFEDLLAGGVPARAKLHLSAEPLRIECAVLAEKLQVTSLSLNRSTYLQQC